MDIFNLLLNLLAVVGGYVVTVTILFVAQKVLQVVYLIVTVVLDALTLGKLKTAKPEQGQKQRQEQHNNQHKQQQQKHNPQQQQHQQQKQRDPQQQQRRDPAQAQNPQREQKPQNQQPQPQPKKHQKPEDFSLVGMIEQWEKELERLPKE